MFAKKNIFQTKYFVAPHSRRDEVVNNNGDRHEFYTTKIV